MESVPFSIETYSGFAEAEGLVRLEDERLVLEFQVKDTILGVIKSKPKTVALPLSELDAAFYQENKLFGKFLGGQLVIKARRLSTVQAIPGNSKGEVKLQLHRKDKQAAKDLASWLQLKLSEV